MSILSIENIIRSGILNKLNVTDLPEDWIDSMDNCRYRLYNDVKVEKIYNNACCLD